MSSRKDTKMVEVDEYYDFSKRKTNRVRAKIIGAVVLIFAFFYIPSFFYWIYAVDISIDMIKMGTLEDSINLEAVLVRNETVITPEKGGRFVPDVNEGERVQAYSRIASIVSETKQNLLEDLNMSEQRIIQYYKELGKSNITASFEIAKNDDEITKKVKQLIKAHNDSDLYKIGSIRSEMDILIKKRIQGILNSGMSDGNFNQLKADRKALASQIDSNTYDIKATEAGLVSFMVDGYENRFRVENINSITPEDLKEIKNNASFTVPIDDMVAAGKSVAKIIPDNEYYLIVILNQDQEKLLKVNDDIKLRIIPIDRTIKAKIDYKSDLKVNNYIVSIKADIALGETAGLRKVDINILRNQYSGLKVRRIALTDIDESTQKAKIMMVKAGLTKYIEVSIVGTNDEFAIIENSNIAFSNGINLYDFYVINSKNVKEGQFLN